MYEERKEKFSFKSFFLTILIVLLFVFLMLWLFPTRSYVDKKLQSTYDIERLSVLYDEVFANNVSRMKDAAIGYFTNERMPQTVGESKKLTLQEMYDLHLVLKMKDIDGNACDVNKSYVEMTKYTEEYRLKVNLSCGEQEDYIIVYLGCYSYCSSGICEKTVSVPSEQTKVEESKTDTTPDKPCDPCQPQKPEEPDTPDEPDTPEEPKKYMYEYKLTTSDTTTCSGWSKWQTKEIKATDTVKVETKTEKELKEYKEVKVQTGTKTETVVVGTKTEKYIATYSSRLVLVGTKQVQIGTTTKQVTEKVAAGTVEKLVGIDSGTSVPTSTSTKKYKVISTDKPTSCSYCENETIYTWEIYNVETVYDVVTKTVEVPVYKTVNEYEEQTVPVYDYRTVDVTEEVTTPIYKVVKVPVYTTITYYRSKTCETKSGTTSVKWSYSKNDSELLDKGYKLTGNVKEA